MLHTPAEQVTCPWSLGLFPDRLCHSLVLCFWPQLVATATKKMAEIQDVVSVAANGSAACVSLGVAWLMARLEAAQNRGLPLLDGAVAAAAVGLEVVLSTSEALVDQMLPPVEHDKGVWINVVSVVKDR